MKRLALLIGLMLPLSAPVAEANPCTDACIGAQIGESVGCMDTYNGGYYAGTPTASVIFNLCLAASLIVMHDCIHACLGEPATGEGPSAVASATTPSNQLCFTPTELMQLSVSIDTVRAEPVAAVAFYLYVDSSTGPPVHLATDSTAADGFTLSFVPALPHGNHIIFCYLYNADLEYGVMGATQYGFFVNECQTSVPTADLAGAEGLRLLSPNPGGADVHFSYRTSHDGLVEATVHDLTGRTVARPVLERQLAGERRARWDGRWDGGERVKAGAYFLRVTRDGQPVGAKKLLILR